MSPLWRDRLHIALSPQRVTVARLRRGIRPVTTAERVIECTPPAAAPGWRAPLAALAEALREPAWQGADAAVVLSNHFVRYALVPFDEQLASAAEHAAFARYQFARVHGEAATAGWAVRQCAPSAGAAQVASAVDQALLDALRATLQPARLRLVSIEPLLAHAFNCAQPSLPAGACWLAVAEPGRLCLALLEPGRWAALTSHRLADDWPQDLAQALDRQRLRLDAGTIPNEVYLYAPELPQARFTTGPWSIRTLTPPADPARVMTPAPPASRSLFLDYQRRWPVPGRASLALLAIGALLTGGALYAHQALLTGIAQHETRLGELTRGASGAIAAANDPHQLDAEIQRANAILRQLAQPWDALFRALESTAARQEKTITLLAIQPDAEKRQVSIAGEAKNLAAMLDYVKLLSADPALANVHLVSHQVQSQDPQRPVRFSLSAEWRLPT